MNSQATYEDGKVKSLGIEWTHIFGPGTGYTVNPVRGCVHDCRWEMPDGKIVECYAQAARDRLDGTGAFKNITFHPNVLDGIRARQKPAGIFIDSMSDLLGNGVKVEWIQQVLEVMGECRRHLFFVLTKNPGRLPLFDWPHNVLLGLSAPPSFMYGKKLEPRQQQVWFEKGMGWLAQANAQYKWVSLEPLAVDVTETLAKFYQTLQWAVIGAGTAGAKSYQPEEELFEKTLQVIYRRPLFFKGNLSRALAARHGGWREEYPRLTPIVANLKS